MIRFLMCLQQNGCHRVTTKQKKTLQKVTNNKTKTTKATHTHTQSVQDRRKSVAKGIVVNVTWPCGLALDLCQVLAFQQFFPFRFLPFKFLPFKFLCLYPVYVLVGRKNTQEHGTKIPQLDLTFPPKEFTEYGHAYCTLRLDMMTSSCTTPAKHHTRPHDHEDFAKKQSHLPKVFLSSVTCSSVQNKLMRRAI